MLLGLPACLFFSCSAEALHKICTLPQTLAMWDSGDDEALDKSPAGVSLRQCLAKDLALQGRCGTPGDLGWSEGKVAYDETFAWLEPMLILEVMDCLCPAAVLVRASSVKFNC